MKRVHCAGTGGSARRVGTKDRNGRGASSSLVLGSLGRQERLPPGRVLRFRAIPAREVGGTGKARTRAPADRGGREHDGGPEPAAIARRPPRDARPGEHVTQADCRHEDRDGVRDDRNEHSWSPRVSLPEPPETIGKKPGLLTLERRIRLHASWNRPMRGFTTHEALG